MSKKALIITDGTEAIKKIALNISDALTGFTVKVCSADKFEGTDLLPADVFFLGCERNSPSSFSYIEEMFKHISLASRKCSVFSVNLKTINYLCALVKDCEASLGAPLHVVSKEIDKSALKKWADSIIK